MNKKIAGVDKNTVIKRYMSLDKFEKLINSGNLYFSRFDSFIDKLEGGISSLNYTDISVSLELFDLAINYWPSDSASPKEAPQEKKITQIEHKTFRGLLGDVKKISGDAYLKQISSWIYASCWTDLDHECEAMWSLYGITGVGCTHKECCPHCESTHGMSVCIETTVGSILENLELDDQYNFSIQKVEYINHKQKKFQEHEFHSKPFHSKAMHFSYENEIRLMLWPNRTDVNFSYVFGESTTNEIKHHELKIKDMSSLIKKIILSPVSVRTSKEIRKSHAETYGSNLGLEESLSNKKLRAKVQSICTSNCVNVEIVDSDLNQTITSDCYTFMEDL